MKIFFCFMFLFASMKAQDSTFLRYREVVIVDSVIFVGDTARYEMEGDWHFGKRQTYLSDTHRWMKRDDERICSSCLRWEKFHEEKVPVYKYDPFYLAKRVALRIMKEKK